MLFSEKEDFTMPSLPNKMIYFLIDNGEVVYVGKTENGLFRPLSHKDKKYDTIKIIFVKGNVNELEGEFIAKYTPKYNRVISGYISFRLAKEKIRKIKGSEKTTLWDIQRLVKQNSIKVENLNGTKYIRPEDFSLIFSQLSAQSEFLQEMEVRR